MPARAHVSECHCVHVCGVGRDGGWQEMGLPAHEGAALVSTMGVASTAGRLSVGTPHTRSSPLTPSHTHTR